MTKAEAINIMYQSKYEKAHQDALLRKIPFTTCLHCNYYNDGCTIGFKLRRHDNGKDTWYVCKDFFDIEKALEQRIESKSW